MYSIVMVAAMTTAPETPDFFFKNKGGCQGCYGGCSGSCYGCYGCGGGCMGWSHGCRGYSCSGCWGCHGYVTVQSYGCCGGCKGSCYGGYAYGGGCCGGYYAPAYSGVYVAPYYPSTGTPPPPVDSAIPPAKDPKKDPKDPKAGPGGESVTDVPIALNSLPNNRAQVVVFAPADAKLFADGQATTLTGSERVFQTPDLATGRDFQYSLKLEYTEGTETKSATKEVLVRGGHRTVVDFTTPVNDKASTSITVNLPAKAKLFVDGQSTPATGGTHVFRTPELTRGKPYVYQFRAEVAKDGKTEVETREVNFKGGEAVTVNFNEPTAVRTASR